MNSDLPASPTSPWNQRWVWPFAVVTITIAALWPVLTCQFVEWDDPHNVWANPDFNPPALASPARYWKGTYEGLYIPVTYTAWTAIAFLAHQSDGLDPHIFHAANLVVHLGCALLVFAVLRMVLGRDRLRARADAAAAIGAMVFAVHPIQVEAVAWVSGLKDLLCGLFSLAAILTCLRSQDWPALLAATACYVLALLSKPAAISVPAIALVLLWLVHARSWRRILPVMVAWFAVGLGIALLTRRAQPAVEAASASPLLARPGIALDALAVYLKQIVIPRHLVLDYGRTPQRVIESGAIYVTWIVPVGVAVAMALGCRRSRRILASGLVFLLALLPMLGLVPFDFQVYSTVSDHYAYLSMFGVALAAATVVGTVNRGSVLGLSLLLVALLGARSWMQSWTWHDTRTLFGQVLSVNPGSWLAQINLSADALMRGDAAAAERHARQALQLRPSDGRVQTNLALALGMQGRMEEAISGFRKAIELAADDVAAHVGLGQSLAALGRTDEARAAIAEALRLDPQHHAARRAMSLLERAAPTSNPAPR